MGVNAPPLNTPFPRLTHIGISGLLVTFSDALSEPANRAALAFRACLETRNWQGVAETTTSLTSVYIAFDPHVISHANLSGLVEPLLASRDWFTSNLPQKRKIWRIPTVFGGDYGPQLAEAAALAGLSVDAAIAQLSTQKTRILTLGFAPGQPYLGTLPRAWDIPRQTGLTAQVPVGALVVAIRQFVLFTAAAPTGWRHIGRTEFRGFRPEDEMPFALRPGDEVIFDAIEPEKYEAIKARDFSGNGGATWKEIP